MSDNNEEIQSILNELLSSYGYNKPSEGASYLCDCGPVVKPKNHNFREFADEIIKCIPTLVKSTPEEHLRDSNITPETHLIYGDCGYAGDTFYIKLTIYTRGK